MDVCGYIQSQSEHVDIGLATTILIFFLPDDNNVFYLISIYCEFVYDTQNQN